MSIDARNSSHVTLAWPNLVLTAAFMVACGGQTSELLEAHSDVEGPDLVEQKIGPGPERPQAPSKDARTIEASYVLKTAAKERIAFYVGEDQSVGILAELSNRETDSLLNHPAFADASPAEIYYALDTTGEVPSEIVQHHEKWVAEGSFRPFAEIVAEKTPGWAQYISSASSSSPCLNATFTANHCAHPQYADSVCRTNTSGSWYWIVPGANRYKAGYCLQSGQNRAWLYYLRGYPDDPCLYFNQPNYVWGLQSHLSGDLYSATTYRVWTWWRGAGGAYRSWHHYAGSGSGDLFDWGQRYSADTCN